MMMDVDPLVSVVVPVYNGCEALRRAMASILKQTCRDLKLIVVDDCSADPIEDVVRACQDERIIYVRHVQNKGVAAAWQRRHQAVAGTLWALSRIIIEDSCV